MATSLEKANAPLTWVVIAVVAGVGWWVRAHEGDIVKNAESVEEVRAITATNAKHIDKLGAAVQLLADREERLERDVEKASKNAEANKELLIKIAAKLEVE